jgi:cellulose synthase/poly-beta-1,6-N-acetylglucosamine synthase-like glycosyltransferase
MDNLNLHTFVIMAYKEAPFIERTIESCLQQNQQSQVCLATSTPTERILNLGRQFDIPVYVNPDHRNIAGDWMFALTCARTPWLRWRIRTIFITRTFPGSGGTTAEEPGSADLFFPLSGNR